jgi:hypothetical protein
MAECIRRHKPKTLDHMRLLITNYIFFYNHERIQLKTKLAPLEKRRQLRNFIISCDEDFASIQQGSLHKHPEAFFGWIESAYFLLRWFL